MNISATFTAASSELKRGKSVNTKHVDLLISNYKKERWLRNTKNLGKPDALSTWYGLKELESFLSLAKENQADGIKMYYGVYPGDFAGDPELQGRQTVVLVATKQKTTAQGVVNKDIYISKEGSLEILAFNYGRLCPPYCTNEIPPYDDGFFEIELSNIGTTLIQNGNHVIVV